MIQRIQTFWLLLSAVCIALCFVIPFAHNTHLSTIPPVSMVTENLTANKNTTLFVLTIALMCNTLISIFVYKNRPMQKLMVLICLLFSIAITAFMVYIGNNIETHTTLYFGIALPAISILFLVFAFVGIRKDHKLIESADRLR